MYRELLINKYESMYCCVFYDDDDDDGICEIYEKSKGSLSRLRLAVSNFYTIGISRSNTPEISRIIVEGKSMVSYQRSRTTDQPSGNLPANPSISRIRDER